MSHRCLDAQRSARPRCFLRRLFGFDPLHPDAVGWYRRALGERRVGRILGELGRQWRVLHAVPQGDGDGIDHLVIGPSGVFAVTTSGTVAAEVEARDASRSLSRATGLAIVAEAIMVGPARGAHPGRTSPALVPTGRLLRHLRDLPASLGPGLVASIARAAEEWTTWRPFSVDAGYVDPDGDFMRLHVQVTSARTRRILWQVAGIAVLTATVGALASGVFF